MSSPFPINSPLDPNVPFNLKDYNYMSPLLADGSNFPCKGYQKQTPFVSKATYEAGQSYNMTVQGSATHGGGSCQLSLSYDNGNTFKVIKSIIGGCPLDSTYSFTIPSFAPSSTEALFAWTWFNEIGNREMYMNCARVTINGMTPGRHRRSQVAQGASMASLPGIFVCNVNNGCSTVESEDVQFPDPGTNVDHGMDQYPTKDGSGFNANGASSTTLSTPEPTMAATSIRPAFVTPPYMNSTATATDDISASYLDQNVTATTSTTVTTTGTTSLPFITIMTISVTPSPSSISTPTSSNNMLSSSPSSLKVIPISFTATYTSPSPTSTSTTISQLLTGPCVPGTFACNTPTTFSQCVQTANGSTAYTYFGPVAEGMQCVNGTFTRQNDGPCSTDGELVCDTAGYGFFLCDHGGLIYMGAVARGTKCVQGQIVMDPDSGLDTGCSSSSSSASASTAAAATARKRRSGLL